jgi:hypothetical protein
VGQPWPVWGQCPRAQKLKNESIRLHWAPKWAKASRPNVKKFFEFGPTVGPNSKNWQEPQGEIFLSYVISKDADKHKLPF